MVKTKVSLNNGKKETPKNRKFNEKCFLEEPRDVDWENYLKIYKKDTAYLLIYFFQK